MKWLLLAAAVVLIAIAAINATRKSGGTAPRPEAGAQRDTGPREPADPALKELFAVFAPSQRTAFDPVTEDSDSDAPVSKFGGAPWLPQGTAWPVCPGCKKPMHFFAQLDVASLPEEAGVVGSGLIQLFMCTAMESQNDVCLQTWEHGAPSELVRLVDTSKAGANSDEHANSRSWPARRVVAWQPIVDFPHYEDWEDVGLAISGELEAAFENAEATDTAPSANGGDKVGGWPLWVQSAEWGHCKECGTKMHLVLQIDSEDNVPFMFGDVGIGHICQCPDHPAQLTWGWACT